MEEIKYRKIVVFGRLLISGGFVLTSFILILLSFIIEDAPLYRKIGSIGAAIAGLAYFGRLYILMHFLLLRNPTMLAFDAENVYVKDRTIKRKNIRKIDERGNAPVGFLWIKTPAFVIHCNDGEEIIIPTYHVLTKKDNQRITKILRNLR